MANSNTQNALGNSIDIRLRNNILRNYSEIRADIPISEYQSIRIWGQVKDAAGNPVPYALLKLVRTTNGNNYTGVAHTTSDCQGFYQFDLCVDEGAEYKILASKSNTGDELTMQNTGNCPVTQSDGPCPNASTFSVTDCNCDD